MTDRDKWIKKRRKDRRDNALLGAALLADVALSLYAVARAISS